VSAPASTLEQTFEKGKEVRQMTEQRHVTFDSDSGKWRVVAPGAERASAVEGTQAAAIDRAREILTNQGGGELVIHRPSGQIRGKDTVPPGHDPFPPRG